MIGDHERLEFEEIQREEAVKTINSLIKRYNISNSDIFGLARLPEAHLRDSQTIEPIRGFDHSLKLGELTSDNTD